jgi:hypothetical protein
MLEWLELLLDHKLVHISNRNWVTSIGKQISEGGGISKKRLYFNPFVYYGLQ